MVDTRNSRHVDSDKSYCYQEFKQSAVDKGETYQRLCPTSPPLLSSLIHQKIYERTTQTTSATSALNSLSIPNPQKRRQPRDAGDQIQCFGDCFLGRFKCFGFPRRRPLPELPARGFCGFFVEKSKSESQTVKGNQAQAWIERRMNKGNNYQPFLRVTTLPRNDVCGSGGWVCVGGSSAHVDVAVGIDIVPRRSIADPLRAREMHLVVPIRLKVPLNPPASHIVMRLESHTLEAPLVRGPNQRGVNR